MTYDHIVEDICLIITYNNLNKYNIELYTYDHNIIIMILNSQEEKANELNM